MSILPVWHRYKWDSVVCIVCFVRFSGIQWLIIKLNLDTNLEYFMWQNQICNPFKLVVFSTGVTNRKFHFARTSWNLICFPSKVFSSVFISSSKEKFPD